MPRTLSRVQILRTGTWTGSAGPTKFTTDDLDQVVQSFDALGTKLGLRPHLKLGHTDAQKFFGQRSGFPSLGEVAAVYREDDVLYADFVNVPEALLDLVVKRRYTQVSVELYPSYEYEGSKFSNVLVAVALLGAELPAVKGLKDLADALYKEVQAAFAADQGKLEFTMPAENKKTDETAPAAAGTDPVVLQRLTAMEAENKRLTDQLAAQALSAAREKVTAVVDAALGAGRLLPKLKDTALALGEAVISQTTKIKFGEGDKAVEKLPAELFAELINGLGVAVQLGERGVQARRADESTGGKTAGTIIDERARKLVSEGKHKDYAEAHAAVIAGLEPDLKQRYADGE